MQRIFFLFLLISMFSLVSNAETRYWVAAAGNLNDPQKWNTSPDGSGTSGVPGSNDDVIINRNAAINFNGSFQVNSFQIINNAIVIFSNATGSVRNLSVRGIANSSDFLIAAGSRLSVTGSGAIVISLASGATAEIFGILDISGTNARMNHNSGVTYVKPGGSIRYGGNSSNPNGTVAGLVLEQGSVFEIYKNGGIFPEGNYDPASLILNSGAVSSVAGFALIASEGSYGNYELNSPLMTGPGTAINASLSFNNVFIRNTGTSQFLFSNSSINSHSIQINGRLTIAAGAVMNVNSALSGTQPSSILVKGDVELNGLLTETGNNSGCRLELTGSLPSTFSCAPASISNSISLRINKTGADVVATSDIELPQAQDALLSLINGHLDMKINNKKLTVKNPAVNAINISSLSSHIIGKLSRNTSEQAVYIFPVSNNGAQWAKAAITPSSASPASWTVEFKEPNPDRLSGLTPGFIEQVTDYFWNIESSGSVSAANIRFFYDGLAEPGVLLPYQLKVLHFDNQIWKSLGGSDNFGNIINTLGTSGGSAPQDPVTVFGQFALGGIFNTLPVTIEYFSGKR